MLDVGVWLLPLVLKIRRDVFVDWRFGVGSVVLEWRFGARRVFRWGWVFFDGLEAVFGPDEACVVGGFGFLFFWFCDADGRDGGNHEVVAGFGLLRQHSRVE